MPAHVPVFLITTWLLAMLPGAGQALMVRQTLSGGRRAAWPAIAGNATGLLVWATAAALGLSALLLSNPGAYRIVRLGGGVVLVILGAGTLLRRDETRPAGFRSGYAAGLTTTLGNPKAGVFAVSVLPQFVTAHGPVLLSSIALGALWAAVNVSWYVVFTWGVERGQTTITKPAIRRRLRILTGSVLLLLGLAVAAGVS